MGTPVVKANGLALRKQFKLKELNEKEVAEELGKSPNYFISALAESKKVDGFSILPVSVTKLLRSMYGIEPSTYVEVENEKHFEGSTSSIDYNALSKAIKDGIVEAFKEIDFKQLVKDGLIEALNFDSKRGEE